MGHVEKPLEARVESVMSRHVLCMNASDELLAAIRTMFSRRYSCVVVARDGKICGILTERDVVRLAASRPDSLSQMTIEEGMTPQVTSISPQTTLVDAARLMKKHDYRRFPVVSEDGTLLGLVTQSDIVSGIKSELEQYSHYLEREVEARTRSLKAVNDELARLSVTDPLTGLNNRRSLFHHMELQMSRLQRIGGHLSCILIDIDHFKRVNDTYGHKCGDYVLSGLARLVRAWLRLHDFVARYGGEEFVAVIEGDEQAAYCAAERIRQQTANVRFSHKDKSFRVTISAGVASRAFPSTSLDAESLLTAADTAMYAAKRAGRNRIARASLLGPADESLPIVEKTLR